MSEKTDYSEFKKSELENWIELSHAFLDNQGVPRKDGGTLSIYGRIERYSVIKSQELAALRSELDTLKSLLKSLEWSNVTDMGNFCPMCHAASHRGNHFYDCELEAALAGKE